MGRWYVVLEMDQDYVKEDIERLAIIFDFLYDWAPGKATIRMAYVKDPKQEGTRRGNYEI